MNPKEIAAIIISAVSITVSILSWMEVRFASKEDVQFMYVETQMGINDIRLRNFEARGLEDLNDSDKRVYASLLAAQKGLQDRRTM